MKKIWVMLVVLLILPLQNDVMDEEHELIHIASLLMAHDLQIDTWEVTIKETISSHEAEIIVHDLKNSHLVTVHEDENTLKYKMLLQQSQKSDFTIQLLVVIPKNDEFKAELSAVIKSLSYNETILKEYKTMADLLYKSYFSSSASMFTCLRTHNDDIIKQANFMNKLNQTFKIKHESTQFDTTHKHIHKKIIYGYTDLWKQQIMVQDQPMNIQFVIKKMDNGESHLIVGTPILINEY